MPPLSGGGHERRDGYRLHCVFFGNCGHGRGFEIGTGIHGARAISHDYGQFVSDRSPPYQRKGV